MGISIKGPVHIWLKHQQTVIDSVYDDGDCDVKKMKKKMMMMMIKMLLMMTMITCCFFSSFLLIPKMVMPLQNSKGGNSLKKVPLLRMTWNGKHIFKQGEMS